MVCGTHPAQVLSGRLPFYDKPTGAIIAIYDAIVKLGERPPTEPKFSNRGVSYAVAWEIATQCWAIDPADRPTFSDALERFNAKPSSTTLSVKSSPVPTREPTAETSDITEKPQNTQTPASQGFRIIHVVDESELTIRPVDATLSQKNQKPTGSAPREAKVGVKYHFQQHSIEEEPVLPRPEASGGNFDVSSRVTQLSDRIERSGRLFEVSKGLLDGKDRVRGKFPQSRGWTNTYLSIAPGCNQMGSNRRFCIRWTWGQLCGTSE